MTRSTWFALTIAALLVLVAGSALGTQALDNGRGDRRGGDRDGASASREHLDRLVDRLDRAGVDTSADELAALAESYGVGGAVRIVVWADAAGASVGEIRALRDAGAGWGRIARELGLKPGLGFVMGGGGHGREDAPGQQKPHDEEDDESEEAEPSASPSS